MKDIISFSIWGDHPMYWVGARKNIELAKEYYPGWICRFYADMAATAANISTLEDGNTEIVLMKRQTHFDGLFWRFLAISDSEAGRVLVRDCDSRLGLREKQAVDEWITSGKTVHIMRDHPYHRHVILGGMWGCDAWLLSNMKYLLDDWKIKDRKGSDQAFLAQMVYPFARFDALEHSEFGLRYANDIRPFPTKREGFEFVGEIFDEYDAPRQDHREAIKRYLNDIEK